MFKSLLECFKKKRFVFNIVHFQSCYKEPLCFLIEIKIASNNYITFKQKNCT